MPWLLTEAHGDVKAANRLSIEQLENDYRDILEQAKPISGQDGKALLLLEPTAQHFPSLGTGDGDYLNRDQRKLLDKCTCGPISDTRVSDKAEVVRRVLSTAASTDKHLGWVQLLPFFNVTQPRWEWHLGGGDPSRPRMCDCTHYCYSPKVRVRKLKRARRSFGWPHERVVCTWADV
eukprot:scaffold2788_cov376-Prasinococcus_capsulatus_cf.AAC.2